MAVKKLSKVCDKWKSGLCAAIPQPTYCPEARAKNSPAGRCCHHPKFKTRELLSEARRLGIPLPAKLDRRGLRALAEKVRSRTR